MAGPSGLRELRPREAGTRVWTFVASSSLAAHGRRWAAAHVRRRDEAIRRRRLLRMTRARDAFRADVREITREAGALRRKATELLSRWAAEQADGVPPGAEALRAALAGNAGRVDEARARIPALRDCLGAPTSRAADEVLSRIGEVTSYGVKAVEERLEAIEHPERGLLLRATGPGAWIVTPDRDLDRALDEAVRRFEAEASAALHRAGWDPERDRWTIR